MVTESWVVILWGKENRTGCTQAWGKYSISWLEWSLHGGIHLTKLTELCTLQDVHFIIGKLYTQNLKIIFIKESTVLKELEKYNHILFRNIVW